MVEGELKVVELESTFSSVFEGRSGKSGVILLDDEMRSETWKRQI